MVRSISIPTSPVNEHVVRVTPLPQDQLQFQPGDVLGFYVESHGLSNEDNGMVLLNNGSHASEWCGLPVLISLPIPHSLAAALTQLESMEYSGHQHMQHLSSQYL